MLRLERQIHMLDVSADKYIVYVVEEIILLLYHQNLYQSLTYH